MIEHSLTLPTVHYKMNSLMVSDKVLGSNPNVHSLPAGILEQGTCVNMSSRHGVGYKMNALYVCVCFPRQAPPPACLPGMEQQRVCLAGKTLPASRDTCGVATPLPAQAATQAGPIVPLSPPSNLATSSLLLSYLHPPPACLSACLPLCLSACLPYTQCAGCCCNFSCYNSQI